MAKRVILFLLTNLAITFVLGIVLNLIFKVTGIQGQSTAGILVLSLVFGFSGSLISLFMSKSMALRSVGAEVITQPRNEAEQWLFNTVQRQAQQANIPMPDIAIYHSADVNAFATGATKSNSLVAVSTGLLNSMTKDEAEAVVARSGAHCEWRYGYNDFITRRVKYFRHFLSSYYFDNGGKFT